LIIKFNVSGGCYYRLWDDSLQDTFAYAKVSNES